MIGTITAGHGGFQAKIIRLVPDVKKTEDLNLWKSKIGPSLKQSFRFQSGQQ